MKALKITIILSCLITAFTCSAAKYQIKVLNTPTITIDNREAKVGDWFNDQSVIVWSRDNQAMRVVSDENKVYALSAKLYKEAKAKKFSDFILYTKPLAARGTKDLDLIEQLAERFDQDFLMLDEIVIDLSDIELPENPMFHFNETIRNNKHQLSISPRDGMLIIKRHHTICDVGDSIRFEVKVNLYSNEPVFVTDTFVVEYLPL